VGKDAAGRHTSIGCLGCRAILALPRPTKRLIMLAADAAAIPTAFWAALVLKFDRLDPYLEQNLAYFAVAVGSALFFSLYSGCIGR